MKMAPIFSRYYASVSGLARALTGLFQSNFRNGNETNGDEFSGRFHPLIHQESEYTRAHRVHIW
jgi:hypothetical protein